MKGRKGGAVSNEGCSGRRGMTDPLRGRGTASSRGLMKFGAGGQLYFRGGGVVAITAQVTLYRDREGIIQLQGRANNNVSCNARSDGERYALAELTKDHGGMVRRAKVNAFGMDTENIRGELGRHSLCVERERSELPRKVGKEGIGSECKGESKRCLESSQLVRMSSVSSTARGPSYRSPYPRKNGLQMVISYAT